MSIRCTGTLLVLAVISVAIQAARADTPLDAKKAIQAAYNRNNAAKLHRDVGAILATYAPGYTSVNQNGLETTRSDEEERQHWAELLTPPGKVKKMTRVVDLKLQDGGAVVTVTAHEEMSYVSRKTRTVQHLTFDEKDRDFWVQSQNHWLWKRSRTLSVSAAP